MLQKINKEDRIIGVAGYQDARVRHMKLKPVFELLAADFTGFPNVICVQIIAFRANPKSLGQLKQVRAAPTTHLENT